MPAVTGSDTKALFAELLVRPIVIHRCMHDYTVFIVLDKNAVAKKRGGATACS